MLKPLENQWQYTEFLLGYLNTKVSVINFSSSQPHPFRSDTCFKTISFLAWRKKTAHILKMWWRKQLNNYTKKSSSWHFPKLIIQYIVEMREKNSRALHRSRCVHGLCSYGGGKDWIHWKKPSLGHVVSEDHLVRTLLPGNGSQDSSPPQPHTEDIPETRPRLGWDWKRLRPTWLHPLFRQL